MKFRSVFFGFACLWGLFFSSCGVAAIRSDVVPYSIHGSGGVENFESRVFFRDDLTTEQFKGFVSIFQPTENFADDIEKKGGGMLYDHLATELASSDFFVFIVDYQDKISSGIVRRVIEIVSNDKTEATNPHIMAAIEELKPLFTERCGNAYSALEKSKYAVYFKQLPHYMTGASLGANAAFISAELLPKNCPIVFMNFASAFVQTANLDTSLTKGLNRLRHGISFLHSSRDELALPLSVEDFTLWLKSRGIEARYSYPTNGRDHSSFVIEATLARPGEPSIVASEIIAAAARYNAVSAIIASYDRKMDSIAALNMAHVSMNRIIEAEDRVTLTNELQFILNNLMYADLRPDDELIGAYRLLLGLLAESQLTELEISNFYNSYTPKKIASLNLRDAVLSAVVGYVMSGGEPVSAIAGFAGSVGKGLVSDYFWGDTKRFIQEQNALNYRLEKEKIKKLSDARQEFLAAFWKIFQKYGVSDKERLSEQTIKNMIAAINDDDPERGLRNLERLEGECQSYPQYAFYCGLKAYEATEKLKLMINGLPTSTDVKILDIVNEKVEWYRKKASDYYRAYEALCMEGRTLLRRDYFYAESIKHRLSYEFAKLTDSEVRFLLRNLVKNINPDDSDGLLFAASFYFLLGDTVNAKECLQRDIDRGHNVEQNKNLLNIVDNSLTSIAIIPIRANLQELRTLILQELSRQGIALKWNDREPGGIWPDVHWRANVEPSHIVLSEAKNSSIRVAVPVSASAWAYPLGIKTKTVRAWETVHSDVRLYIDSAWNLRTSFTNISFSNWKTNMSKAKKWLIERFTGNIRRKFEGFIRGEIDKLNERKHDISPQVNEVWRQSFVSLPVAKAPELFLNVEPRFMHVGNAKYENDEFKADVAVGVMLNLSEKSRVTAPTALPSNATPFKNKGVALRVPIRVGYDEIRKAVVGQKFELGDNSFAVKSLDFEERNGDKALILVVSHNIKLLTLLMPDIRLPVWVDYDEKMRVLSLNLEASPWLALITGERLSLRSGKNLLFVPVGSHIDGLVDKANKLIPELKGPVTIDGKFDGIRFSGLKIDRDGIELNVMATGDVAVVVNPEKWTK